jgi:hypothetical protein
VCGFDSAIIFIPNTFQPHPTNGTFGSAGSNESAELDLLVEGSPVDDMLSSDIVAIDFSP